MLLYIVWGVQKTQNLTKEYTYRVRTLIWPFYFNLDYCALSQNQHAWKLMFFLVMENVTGIHFSKCKCPGGYGGDPYNFSQESWDVCQCSFWSWRMWVKSIFQKVNVPAATMAILMVFLKNIRCHGNFLTISGLFCRYFNN